MKLLCLLILFLALVSLASAHRHRHHRHGKFTGKRPKKIVKIIHVGGGNNFHGPKKVTTPPAASSSSSSSSSSSEEVPPAFDTDNEEVKTTLPAPPPTTTTKTTTTTTTTTTTKKPEPKCDEGWLTFQRIHSPWCVLVGNKGANNHQLTQPEAEKVCKQFQATLTGLTNDDERKQIANEALHQLGEIGIEMGAVWLGAKTRAACKSESCGIHDTFEWSDGSTSGTGGFVFGKNEPDDEIYPGNHACLQQIIMSPTFVPSTDEEKEMKSKFQHGELDKYKCESPEHPKTRLYACGKKPQ
ncbi:Protein CBR-CLEC-232 [Caenorhabditis briggsae]|uniref:Protein CBR-CLEC-232 n=1 Tax=Caenorhabditis briggsae TaxID=6238 RepID=A8WYR3_CAEBR|nr:Protein CBR-CLEC-232 [Caenorhabditis briggsae]CAP25521.1 Protein CBR-CLEC-232 [Caenorhabditis briggsae]